MSSGKMIKACSEYLSSSQDEHQHMEKVEEITEAVEEGEVGEIAGETSEQNWPLTSAGRNEYVLRFLYTVEHPTVGNVRF